jgi:hypothetical protein
MLTIEYDPINGDVVPDSKWEEYLLKNKHNCVIGGALGIYTLRLFIIKGIIDCNSLQIKFEDTILTIDAKGNLSDWPLGFCDHEEIILAKMFKLNRKESYDNY